MLIPRTSSTDTPTFKIYGSGRKWTLLINGLPYIGFDIFKRKRDAQLCLRGYKERTKDAA